MKTKKILALALAAVLLVAVSVVGTMAYLMDTSDVVTNEFTGAKVEVMLQESTGPSYQIIPGGTDTKDPEAWIVTGSEAAYLFVQITETDNMFYVVDEYGVGTPYQYVDYELADGWTVLSETTSIETNPYVTVIWREVEAGDVGVHYPIIEDDTITYSEHITNGALDVTNLPKISFKPYAIQSANMDDYTTEQLWTMAQAAQ